MRIDDTRPIWIQLADSFRARITDGTWKPGQKIPSVRDLAIEAGTNPNTARRVHARQQTHSSVPAEPSVSMLKVPTASSMSAGTRTCKPGGILS